MQTQSTSPTSPHATNQANATEPSKEQLMFEYDQLRKETLQTDLITLQILAGVVVIAIGLMTIAFSEQLSPQDEFKPFLLFLAESVAFIGLMQNTDRVRSTIIIASYIRNCIEVDLEIKWETRLARFREIKPKDMSMNLMTQQRLVYMVLMLANALLGIIYLAKVYLAMTSLWIVLVIIMAILALTVTGFVWQWRKYEQINLVGITEYDEIWQRIKKREQARTHKPN